MLEEMENIIFILVKQFSVRRASFFFPTNQRASLRRKERLKTLLVKKGKGKFQFLFHLN